MWSKLCSRVSNSGRGRRVNFLPCQVLNYRERLFSDEEICELLEKAAALGLSLERGSDLEQLTIGELERLVNVVQ